MGDINLVRAEVDRRRDAFLEVLFRLLAQPSISTQNVGVDECAELVAATLEANGISARIMPTAGMPVVYGERIVGDDANTILIYGHYDVQPPEPYEEWLSPPFEPTIRDGRIWARGVGDNKGQFLAHILAVKVLADLDLLPRVNLKFFLEGEEESGSPNLRPFVEQNKELLAADLFYAADGPSHVSGRPVVCYGVRGHLSMELTATGVNRDLHSGNWGGPTPNPVWMLVDLLNTMRHPDGRAAIEGFYAEVVPPTPYERDLIDSIPFDAEEFKANLGIDEFYGPEEWSYFEKILFQPTLNITGISGGYTGAGVKSVVPSKATLKLECRLVKNQTPDEVYAKIERHVQRYGRGITIQRKGKGTLPSRASSELPVSQTVAAAVAEGYGIEPVVMPHLGASAGNSLFTDDLGIPTVWVTYANHDEDNHAPNENMTLDAYYRGIVASAAVILRFAAMDRAAVDASLATHRSS